MAKKAKGKTKSNAPTIVVGIGASAGGILALRKFFAKLGHPRGISFILIQHLDESGRQLSHDFLSQQSNLPVAEVRSGMKLESGMFYHALPHSAVSIKDGIFQTEQTKSREDQSAAIDYLFRSIAKDQGHRAVGIVLSGEGSDGAQGLKAISDAGGMCLAQLPDSAEFASMPEQAIAAGAVDHIIAPEEMPAELASYESYLAKLLSDRNTSSVHHEITAAITEICEILHKATKHDFKHYKTSTLVRRIQRRMQVLQLVDVQTYVENIRHDTKEIDSLFKELLINVTSFFRDPEAFQTLQDEVFRKAFENRKSDQKYRAWVAGCSTGEEVYTLAILICEVLEKIEHPPEIQIIATDIDEIALSQARKGSYPVTIAEHVSSERLKKYFIKKAGRYHVTKELREMVLFSSHNLINDPPFSQLDLISCRNVLIYLGSHLQKKLIPVFHYALRPSGCLFLGTSETVTGHKELFRIVSAKSRIAQRKATAIRSPGFSSSIAHVPTVHTADASRDHDADLHLVGQRILLDEFSPKYAIVNDEARLLSLSSGVAQYFDPSEGTFQNNLMKLVKPSLRVGLRSAFSEAKKHKRKITHEDSTMKVGDELQWVGITVQPMPQLGDESGLFMVVFQYLGLLTSKETRAGSTEIADAAVVEQLERELSVLREDLDRSIQDLEASNEELKSSNEELLSMNEELQSANEELEVSKEEVQAANEALMVANIDLENLMASTDIAIVFLDDNFNIQNYTPLAETIYNISRKDINRPLSHFTHLADSMPEFRNAAGDIDFSEKDIHMKDGRWILRRLSPYRNAEGVSSGFVVSFIDMSNLRSAQENYRELANSMPNMVWTAAPDGNIDYFNERFIEVIGSAGAEKWREAIHPDDKKKFETNWLSAIKEGRKFETEIRLKDFKTNSYRWFLGRAVPTKNSNHKIKKWFGSFVDINDRVTADEARRESEARFRTIADTAPVMVWMSGPDRLGNWFNKGWLEFTGRRMPQEIGNGWTEGIHPDEREHVLNTYSESFSSRKEFYLEYRLKTATGQYRWINNKSVARFTSDGTFEGYISACMDIQEQRNARETVENSQLEIINERENFRNLFRQTPEFVCILGGPEHTFEFVNDAHIKVLGFDATGQSVREAQPESVEVHVILDRVYQTGITAEHSEIPVTVGNRLRYFNLTYAARRDTWGKINGIMILGTEITDQVMNRDAIASQKDALELTLSGSSVTNVLHVLAKMVEHQTGGRAFVSAHVVSADKKHLLHASSPSLAADLVSQIREMPIGLNLGVCGTAAFTAEPVMVMDLMNDPMTKDYRKIAQAANLKSCWSTPILSSTGEVLGTFALYFMESRKPSTQEYQLVDLVSRTAALLIERRNAFNDLRLAREESEKAKLLAEAASFAKTRFLANMSHEIRTPLGAIIGFSDLLTNAVGNNDEAQNFVSRIERNSKQLGRLIDELLDLSKIEANHLEIERVPVDLNSAIEDAFAAVSIQAKEKGIQFDVERLAEIPAKVLTDPTRLRQILINLVGNAVKFTEKGTITVELNILQKDAERKLEVRVRDTGIGMNASQQSQIFKAFNQGDSSITRKYGGTGLGLVLSRELARLLGGDVQLESSSIGVGSVFAFTISLGTDEDIVEKSKDKTTTSQKSLAGKNILIVDDSPDNRVLVARYLDQAGASYDMAHNGVEALAKTEEKNFDLILMDLQMPILDGYQAVLKLRAEKNKAIIIALTAHALREERERCLQAGFNDYITKPIDRHALIEKISRQLT